MFCFGLSKHKGDIMPEVACEFKGSAENITKLKMLTENLRFSNFMNIHAGGSEWVEVLTGTGKSFIRGLLKKYDIAISDNFASAGTQYPIHQHPGHEIFVVYKGSMDLNVDGKEIKVSENSKPYYFDATKPHSAYFDCETQYIAITIPADKDWPEGG